MIIIRKKIITQILPFMLFFVLFWLIAIPTSADQTCSMQSSYPRVQGGLISAPGNVSSNFSNSSGLCVIDPSEAFAPYLIPSYDSLKSSYFDQSKLGPTQKIILIDTQNQNAINLNTSFVPTPTPTSTPH